MKASLPHLGNTLGSDRFTKTVRILVYSRLTTCYVPFILFALPLFLLLPGMKGFPYPPGNGTYSDLVISHYPYALFIQRALLAGEGLPLWSPSILSGQPLAANPLAGIWYPPGWLALLLPLPLGLNLIAALHLGWGGLGMYQLLRVEGLGKPGAMFGGLAFALLPKFYAHYGAGHLTLIYAVTWTPWLLASSNIRKSARETGRKFLDHLANWNLKPGLVFALIFLADPRWAFYAGLLCLGYQVFLHRPVVNKGFHHSFQILEYLFNLGLAGLLAAPLAMPMMELTRLSTRSGLTPTDNLRFSLPPVRLLGLFFPAFGGFHEWYLYPGAVVFLLALCAIVARIPIQRVTQKGETHSLGLFWGAALILSLLFSLGSYLPFLEDFYRLPGLDLLRVPSRALFITGLSLVALASGSMDHLWKGSDVRTARNTGLLLAALASFTLLLTLGIWKISGKPPLDFAWGSLGFVLGAFWIGLCLRKQFTPAAWFSGLVVLCALDLLVVDRTLFFMHPARQVLAEAGQVVEYLKAQPGFFRVYSPSYSLPQQSAAVAGLQSADGIDPLQLETYVAYMDRATGVPRSGYSVTLPPYSSGDPASDNAAYTPDPQALGLLNVRFLSAEFDLQAPGLILRHQLGETRIYENLLVKPRAWLQPQNAAPGENISAVNQLDWHTDRIEVEAQVPGDSSQLLVLSEVFYPGWKATVDGREAAIQPVAGLLRGLSLDPGIHQIVFVFQPVSQIWGLVFGCGGLLLVLATWVNSIRHQRPLSTKGG